MVFQERSSQSDETWESSFWKVVHLVLPHLRPVCQTHTATQL